MTQSRGGVCGEMCCDSRREEPRVGLSVLVQGGLVSSMLWALANQPLAHLRECSEGGFGVKGGTFRFCMISRANQKTLD